jgi:hypothetical protein
LTWSVPSLLPKVTPTSSPYLTAPPYGLGPLPSPLPPQPPVQKPSVQPGLPALELLTPSHLTAVLSLFPLSGTTFPPSFKFLPFKPLC